MQGMWARVTSQKGGALTKNGCVTALKGNCKRSGKKSLNHQWRGSSKFPVADTVRDTTDELLKAFAKGAS